MSMRQHSAIRWREIILGLATCAITLMFSAQPLTRESVLAELAQSQRNEGLTVAWVNENGGVQAVSFEKRKVIPLKDSLQAFRPEGFKSYNFPRVATDDLCWSHDWSKAAATMFHPPEASLGIYDLSSKATQVIEARVEARMHFTTQCWSPDDKRVAYDSEGSVKVYQIGGDTTSVHTLAKGADVTWSTDGNWIAFRDGDTYYAIHADGTGRKKLFHNHWGRAVSALYWSPDSRVVAYVRELGFLQGGALDAEANELRVRRLEDGSNDRLCRDKVDWFASYHWITSSELMKHP
jgi:Tol biopolymer transport system component